MSEGLPVWEDGAWEGFSALTEDVTADVCVVGLGGSGLACVGELLRAGVDVVGVDAGHVAGGAAGRNGGFLLAGAYDFYHEAVRRHGHERALTLYRATMDEIVRISSETPQAVRLTGSLRIAASVAEEEDCAAQLEAMRRDGLPAEPYSGAEGDGLLIPTDGAFNPLLRCRLLARRSRRPGPACSSTRRRSRSPAAGSAAPGGASGAGGSSSRWTAASKGCCRSWPAGSARRGFRCSRLLPPPR